MQTAALAGAAAVGVRVAVDGAAEIVGVISCVRVVVHETVDVVGVAGVAVVSAVADEFAVFVDHAVVATVFVTTILPQKRKQESTYCADQNRNQQSQRVSGAGVRELWAVGWWGGV